MGHLFLEYLQVARNEGTLKRWNGGCERDKVIKDDAIITNCLFNNIELQKRKEKYETE